MKTKIGFMICILALAACFSACEPLSGATKKPDSTPKKTSTPAVIPADQKFLSTYIDYQRLVSEINNQLRESGNLHRGVSTYDLQQVAQGKLTALEGWAKKHKVPQGYIFNFQKREWEKPVAAKK